MGFCLLILIFLLSLTWALASGEDDPAYPNSDVLARVPWLAERIDRGDADLTIVDVRRDKYFDGRLIPGAVRMPWTLFRHNDLDNDTASRFIGTQAAQKVLGEHGIGRTDTIVLYDAVARDGGATASSYLFWVLEVLGHIPMAVNIDYTRNWVDSETKRVKPYHQLQQLYRGLDPDRAVIVYCNSGRRSSFSYFILTLMGVRNVYAYEASWKEWGRPEAFYPVETTPISLSTKALPGASTTAQTGSAQATGGQAGNPAAGGSNKTPKSGYVFCGG